MPSLSGARVSVSMTVVIFQCFCTVKVVRDPRHPQKPFNRADYPLLNQFMSKQVGLTDDETAGEPEVEPLNKEDTAQVLNLFRKFIIQPQYSRLPIIPIDDVVEYVEGLESTMESAIDAFESLVRHHLSPGKETRLMRTLIKICTDVNDPRFKRLDERFRLRKVCPQCLLERERDANADIALGTNSG
jgi:hypothetical protein